MTDKSKGAVIRPINIDDLARIIQIDNEILGKNRPEYWEQKLELIENQSAMSSLVAVMDDKVVGFIIGNASGWEYGVPETIGWIDTIGVDPDYQRTGVAHDLLNEMISNLKKVGCNTIYTLVNWRDWRLLRFYDDVGFEKGDMLNLELKV
ncbi:MAG TPA: GNAT family N-acetyltransferase [Desulfobacteraceae bacterium]|nr:GNAT family N-acetyltransferase [Desulfobacteraceae bacterium]HPJ67555.1 GNAT family N-acetyltransferase [Desulfobacteraceae bacterium]